jgi:hypothetical protein
MDERRDHSDPDPRANPAQQARAGEGLPGFSAPYRASGGAFTFANILEKLGFVLLCVGGVGLWVLDASVGGSGVAARGLGPSFSEHIAEFVAFIGFASILVGKGLHGGTWQDTVAEELGFLVSTDGKTICGWVREFQVTVQWPTRDEQEYTRIMVDGRGAIPRRLSLGRRENLVSKLLNSVVWGAAGGRDVLTEDPAFDRSVRVQGGQVTALALLDAGTRHAIQAELASSRSLEVQNGVLTLERQGRDGPAAVRSAVGLAEQLTLREGEIPARLVLKVVHDPVPAACRALKLLQVRFPEHPATREAIQAALVSPLPELQLLAARYLGAQGLVHVREIVEAETVPADLRLEGLVHYVLVASVPEALTLIERVGARLDRADLPAETAERLNKVYDTAREPVLLRLLAQAPISVKLPAVRGLGRVGTRAVVESLLPYRDDEGGNGELRHAAREAIAQIQARLGNVEAGRLSVAVPSAGVGGLTVAEPDPAGGVSLAGESPSPSAPVGRGSERGADGTPADA